MTTACRFPERVDGVISIDSAPKDISYGDNFISFTQSVVNFMKQLDDENISKKQAVDKIKTYF